MSGRVTDEGSGVASLELAFEPIRGDTIFLAPPLTCTPKRRMCWFDVSPPAQGVFTARLRSTDLAGNNENLTGPRIMVIVV